MKRSQQFVFDGDASDVYQFIMGPEADRPRAVEVTDGHFAMQCVFLIGHNSQALYSITLGVHVCTGSKFDFMSDDVHWLVWDKEPAEISLVQDQPGVCRADLYLETNPQRWQPRTDGPWVVPMNVGSRLIIAIWRDLIIDPWIRRKRDSDGSQIIQALPSRQAGPTLRTQLRYQVFSRLKAANPTWSQDRVAAESYDELGEIVTAETVRNTYRLMGKAWERGDRIR